MLESKVQTELIHYLESRGHYVIKVVRANKSGVPDLIACTFGDGKFYAIEVKAVGKELNTSPLQKWHIDLINKTGGEAFVASCIDDLKLRGL